MSFRTITSILILLIAFSTSASAAEDWQQAIADSLAKTGNEMPGGVYR